MADMSSPPTIASKKVSPPSDTFNIAYLLYFLLGTSYLLPWYTFISAIDYLELLYPWGQINRASTVAYVAPSVISVLYITFVGLRVSASWRVNTGLALCVAMLALVPVMSGVFISDTDGTVTTYTITIAAVAVAGFGHALVYSSMVASVGRYLPDRYMQALSSGGGAAGVLSSILRILTKAILPQTESGTETSAYLYFGVCVVIMIACMVSYNLADRLPVVWYYKSLKGSEPESVYLLNNNNGNEMEKGVSLENQNGQGLVFYKRIWNQIQGYALAMALTYLVSVSIFPGHITEDIKSSFFGGWYAILLVFCYNISEVIGRSLPGFSLFMTDKKAIVIGGSIARIVFYPLYYLCLNGPAFFQLEVVVMVITSILGLTNGYFTSILFMVAPKIVDLKESETAGSLMVTFLHLGLAGGQSWNGFGYSK